APQLIMLANVALTGE
nr:Chain B, transcription factor REST (version 3) [synthetic construct]